MSERPDPDALLRRVKDSEARAQRGRLKIFFGFAPGVGKTYRMLQVARDLIADQKADVVVGLVETHGRYDTGTLLLGLEVLPKRKVEYRGRTLEEFDLEHSLARRPRILLLDELAHTNAPGLQHAKRWQDVQELLDAGIDVFTTLNVQHIESLNDVVAQITHVQVRETVPDSVLDRADEVELVDIAPEELLVRLKEGKVYVPEQARRAVDHFFQRGNLLALRELALRRTAQHVDEDVLEYREEHGVKAPWTLGERILVCVGAAPSSGMLIRSAARMAAGLRCPWIALFVEPLSLGGVTAADQERLETHLRLAESLGATVSRISAASVAEAVLTYARGHNVTRIIIGKPTHSRLRDRLRGSLLDEVVRGSANIEVHVVSGDERAGGEPIRPAVAQEHAALRTYALSLGLVAVTTLMAAGIRRLYPVPDVEFLYLLSVVLSGIWLGRGPSVLTAALSVAAFDFFFVPPFLTFEVADTAHVLTFAMMFGVGLVVSELTTRLRRQEQAALSRQERTAALYSLSRDLGGRDDASELAGIVARHVADYFAAPVFVLTSDGAGGLQALGRHPGAAVLDSKELGVARWCFEHQQIAGAGTSTLPGSKTLSAPMSVGPTRVGVIAVEVRQGSTLGGEQREFLEVCCRLGASSLERVRLTGEARAAALRARTEEMRSSLLSSVSHDLRTPLAAITGAATSLRDDPKLSGEVRRELLQSVCEEAERLERLVANLLEMTRLESGALVLKRDWIPLEEIVGSTLGRLEKRLGDRPVETHLAADLPLAFVDPVLFEQVFLNLVENALKYAPGTRPIEIRAAKVDGGIEAEVLDRGPGLPLGNEERVFEKFYRGDHSQTGGVGLGLAIARGIVEAHGGTLRALPREGGGAVFRISLPSSGEMPSLVEAGRGVG